MQKYLSISNILIAINALIFLLITPSPIYGLNIYFYLSGFWWQPLSTMFFHADFNHLFMNMAMLFIFGNMIEKEISKTKFIFIYFGGGILTSLLSSVILITIFHNHNLIGASGAISVLLGFYAYFDIYRRKGIFIALLLYSFAPLLLGINIAWYAHIIGFTLGFTYAFSHKKIIFRNL